MTRKQTGPIPEAIAQLQRQFDQFRSGQPRRTKLPEPLWQAAVELAREHGVYPVAHPLRLDYVGLKKRLGGIPVSRRKATRTAFVELTAPPAIAQHECAIGLEWPEWTQNAHPVEGFSAAQLDQSAACLVGSGRMIQIAAQVRILVAVEAIDGRKYAPSIDMRSFSKPRL